MFNVIDFLERMGQDARLRQSSPDEVALALADAEIDPALRLAILSKDPQRIEALLGQDPFCCLLVPGKEQEEDEEESEETPSREGEEVSYHRARRASVS